MFTMGKSVRKATNNSQGDTFIIEVESVNEESLLIYYILIPLNEDLEVEYISQDLIFESLNEQLVLNGFSSIFNIVVES